MLGASSTVERWTPLTKPQKPERGLDVPVLLDNSTVLGQEERVAPVESCGQPRLFWHIKEGSHEVLRPHDCIATAERNFFPSRRKLS